MGKITLKTKFVVLMVAIVLTSAVVNILWNAQSSSDATEREMVDQARSLSYNMDAVWQFMTVNQDLINYDSEGNFEFKNLQCSVAGRSIGKLFSGMTDYSTSYVSLNPRNRADEPDGFETDALNAFIDDPNCTEYYAIVEKDGKRVFRYLAPMVIENSCLSCHGEPAGEIDIAGYPKEGMKVGDVYGAISITIPVEGYEAAAKDDTIRSVILSIVFILITVAVIYLALSVLVTRPLKRLRLAMGDVESGSLDVRIDEKKSSSRETGELAHGFNEMADEINALYTDMESQVQDRTDALRKANDALETQQKQLEEMNEQLRNDSRYKSNFLATMSHELRTPLAATRVFSELIENNDRPKDEEEVRLWKEIDANDKHLLALINDILAMARIDAGKETLNLEVVDVYDIIGLEKSIVEPLASDKGIKVEYKIDEDIPLIVADQEKLRRITENLLSNAIKFTPEGGAVTLSVRYSEERCRLSIVVDDTGIGIPADEHEAVFERFVQADGTVSRHYQGTGLGLALVKEFVSMHHGEVRLESEEGSGSTFTIEIPTDLELDEGMDS